MENGQVNLEEGELDEEMSDEEHMKKVQSKQVF